MIDEAVNAERIRIADEIWEKFVEVDAPAELMRIVWTAVFGWRAATPDELEKIANELEDRKWLRNADLKESLEQMARGEGTVRGTQIDEKDAE